MKFDNKKIEVEIKKLKKKIRDDTTRLEEMTQLIIKYCEHKTEQVRLSGNSCEVPFLVCIDCGYAEELWGCGPWKLAHAQFKAAVLPREEALEHVKDFWHQGRMNEIRFS